MQLRDLSKETAQEAAMVHAKQIQYDRQIADMSLTISKLEANLREAERVGHMHSTQSDITVAHDGEMAKQIKVLSEEVVRQRDKLATHNSELLAMKHRLRAATERANRAEEELTMAKSSSNGDPDSYDTIEQAITSSGSRRRKPGAPPSGSIRSAMRLESGRHGERTEQIGQVVDAVDSFAVSTGTCVAIAG
jgi:chromosome segregation ATPase